METPIQMEMDTYTCVLINWLPMLLNLVMNFFYIFCIFCPLNAEQIKQPLLFLLWSLISSIITFSMSILVGFFVEDQPVNSKQIQALLWVSNCTLSISMTSSVWLSFFYNTQIVPARQALSVWIKRNIKAIIYCACLFERIFSLFQFIFMFLYDIIFSDTEFSNNATMDHAILMHVGRLRLRRIEIAMLDMYFYSCLVVMVMSNGSTVAYLSKHMRRMAAHGHPLSCPQFRGQVRVAVIGTLQGVLYVFCSGFEFLIKECNSLFGPNIHFTVVNFYMLGITLSLGAGVTIFRQRGADIWTRITQWCK